MKIQYFGSAAYEGIPSLFCQCESCKLAMRLGGKNLRTRSQSLINNEILMEFNADTVAHYQKYQFDWTKIKYCFITHSHSDHFYPRDLTMLAEPGYTHNVSHINFYAGKTAYDQICEVFSSPFAEQSRATVTEVKEGDLLQVDSYKILVMHADHDVTATPFIYAIEDKDGKRLLYAHDTGVFSDKVISDMKRLGRFDIVSLDCTGAFAQCGWVHGHMSLQTNSLMKDRLYKEGLADDKTQFIVTHSRTTLFMGKITTIFAKKRRNTALSWDTTV